MQQKTRRAPQPRHLQPLIHNQHDPTRLQPRPPPLILHRLLIRRLGDKIPLERLHVRHRPAGHARPEGTEEVAGGGADGRDEEGGAVVEAAGFVAVDEGFHAEEAVGGVDPGPVEEEEVFD